MCTDIISPQGRSPRHSKGRLANVPRRIVRDTSIDTYRGRRDFAATPEPAAEAGTADDHAPIFVVQKHDATRLHWDFRLEHAGVLWSWAVPKGPSLDPHDKRLAVHVEDHPIDYADFAGTIPEGQYGAGTVETWDRGTWTPLGDAAAGMRAGELKFVLHGTRLNGRFVLVRMKPRGGERADNWLLIKEHDEAERDGADVSALESIPLPKPRKGNSAPAKDAPARGASIGGAPAAGAVRGLLMKTQSPQLASLAEEPPESGDWVSEVKFDGYRLLVWLMDGKAKLMTRNGHDWTRRLPSIARAVERLKINSALLDGELVALREDGVSSFPHLQAALSDGRDDALFLYLFDLLHLDGWDLRPCALTERKRLLSHLSNWRGALRYSDHLVGRPAPMRRRACEMGLEGVICKRADAPYRAGRGRDWLKLKCQGREEFVVLGWTRPAGSRTGIGSLHVGFYDESGDLHYAGGVGTGFSDKELASLRRKLDELAAEAPPRLVYAGDPPARDVSWVRPELVAEVQFIGWSGTGRVRHAVYLGLREDKTAAQVVRPVPDAAEVRTHYKQRARIVQTIATKPKPRTAPKQREAAARATIVTKSPGKTADLMEGVKLTHPDRELWPGISKRQLAEYWDSIHAHALPEIAGRPLALVRCPDGIDGQHFFQKHGKPGMPPQIRAGEAGGAPYLAIDDAAGLIACAQMSAIELHTWGSREDDALHADRLVFDLDPGDGVPFADVSHAAHEVRERLRDVKLDSFCRTSGGKGLHVVVPVVPQADWDTVRAWCRAFAEVMEEDQPDRFVASVPKQKRRGRILVDWLRNGLGSTAVASFCPRARPGAQVATPLTWQEVGPKLDPAAFTIATVPDRLKRQRTDPWAGIADMDQKLPAQSGSNGSGSNGSGRTRGRR